MKKKNEKKKILVQERIWATAQNSVTIQWIIVHGLRMCSGLEFVLQYGVAWVRCITIGAGLVGEVGCVTIQTLYRDCGCLSGWKVCHNTPSVL